MSDVARVIIGSKNLFVVYVVRRLQVKVAFTCNVCGGLKH